MDLIKNTLAELTRKTKVLAYLSLCCSVLMLPILGRLTTLFLVVFAVLQFLDFRNLRWHKDRFRLLAPAMFLYVLYAIGMLYTANTTFGQFDMEIKMSLGIVPIIFILIPSYSRKLVRGILLAFIAGCFLATLVNIYYAIECYELKHYIECFSSGRLCSLIHPSYFAMYLCFAIVVIAYELLKKNWQVSRSSTGILIFLVVYFTVFVIQISSKSGLLSLFLAYFIVLLWYAQRKGKFLQMSVIGLVLLGILSSVALLIPTTNERIMNLVDSLGVEELNPAVDGTNKHIESSKVRMVAWQTATDLIIENPMGVGTGDIKDALMQRYAADGWQILADFKINPHNQFLQTALAIGILGALVLMLWLIFLFQAAWKRKHLLLLFFVVLIFLNYLFESMLEIQAGVLFTMIMGGILTNNLPLFNSKTEDLT